MFPQIGFNNQLLPDISEPIRVKFEAVPKIVSPFGSSTLSWEVTGPSDIIVTINGISVAPVGQKIIRPSISQSFLLIATRANSPDQRLVSTSLSVNLSQCIISDNAFAARFISFFLRRILAEDQRFTLLFPQFEIPVQVFPGQIRFTVSLRYDDGTTFPPLNVMASTTFRLSVVSSAPVFSGRPVVAATNVNVELSQLPANGFQPGVPDENKMIEVARKIKEIIPRVLSSVLPTNRLPANMILRDVSIVGPSPLFPEGGITLTHCPEEEPVVVVA